MVIDRQGRDAAADTVVRFMRRETQSDRFIKTVLFKTRDESLRRVQMDLAGYCDSYVNHVISTSREGWDRLRRTIAFLRSDLPLVRLLWRTWHWRQGTAAAGLAILGGAVATGAVAEAWWILAAAWVALAISWVTLVPNPRPPCEFLEHVKFLPFRSESQWKAYEPLLQGLELPTYNPALHNRPIRTKGEEEALRWLARLQIPQIVFLPITLILALRSPSFAAYLTLQDKSSS